MSVGGELTDRCRQQSGHSLTKGCPFESCRSFMHRFTSPPGPNSNCTVLEQDRRKKTLSFDDLYSSHDVGRIDPSRRK
jgi:hypothetical protein